MKRSSKHVLSHAAIYLVARGLPGIVAFLAIPLFTRLLDPAAYGRYALVLATVVMLNALLFQWLRLSLTRYLPAFANPDEQSKLKSTLISTAGLLIVILGLLAAAAALLPLLAPWREVILVGWLVLTAQALFELCCEYSRAALNPWQFMALQLGRSGAAVGIGVLLINAGFGWWGPIIGMTVGMTIGIAYAGFRDWTDVRFRIDRAILAKLCQYGLPLSLTVALAVVISTSDRFLIAYFMGEDAAGLYAVAFDFTCQTLTLLMMVINLAVFPMAVRAYESHGPEAAKDQMRHNGSLLVAIGLPCVVGLTVLAPGVANSSFGADYRAAAMRIMPLIALGAFLEGMKAYHFDAAFQFVHRTIVQVWIVLVVAAVNVAANLLVIPRWGIEGAAAVSAGAYLLSIGMTVVIGRRHFVLPLPIASMGRAAVASGAMAVVLWTFRWNVSPAAFAAQVAGGAAIYAIILIATNFIGLRDAIIDRLVRRTVTAREVVA
jgi:O-antigen/teichoic acid export membrane protein